MSEQINKWQGGWTWEEAGNVLIIRLNGERRADVAAGPTDGRFTVGGNMQRYGAWDVPLQIWEFILDWMRKQEEKQHDSPTVSRRKKCESESR